jgi:uncharacterized DUF497 family protein
MDCPLMYMIAIYTHNLLNTVRHHREKIHTISARDMHRKERVIYEKAT